MGLTVQLTKNRLRACSAIIALAALAALARPNAGSSNPPLLTSFASPEIGTAYDSAARWFVSQVDSTGLFVYQYDDAGNAVVENNPVRQLMASRLLAALAVTEQRLSSLHNRNITAVMDLSYMESAGIGRIMFDGASKLGSNAMALRALVASPLFLNFQKNAAALATGILSLADSTGKLRPWLIEPKEWYDAEYLMSFYSGEAILALLEYADKSGSDHIYKAAVRIQEHYLSRYVDEIEAHFYPAYVPWHTMSLSALYRRTGDHRYRDAVFVLNDKLLELQDTVAHVGRFYNSNMPQFGSPHASADAIYTEGLTYAYRLAAEAGQGVRCEKYRRALLLGVDNLLSLQIRSADDITPRLNGAIRTVEGKIGTRIDNTQHALEAMTQVMELGQSVPTCS